MSGGAGAQPGAEPVSPAPRGPAPFPEVAAGIFQVRAYFRKEKKKTLKKKESKKINNSTSKDSRKMQTARAEKLSLEKEEYTGTRSSFCLTWAETESSLVNWKLSLAAQER